MINYAPTPCGERLHRSNKNLKILVGPFGSGKSCACAVEVLANACAQTPASDGVRYSRVGIVRSTYGEIRTAARNSLMEVLPSECGYIHESGAPIRGFYLIPLPDGTTVSLELELWAVGSADECHKLRSCNWSFCWINEATGCAPEVHGTVMSRIGRFPPRDMGGATWGGVIMDFNMPAPGSWLDSYLKNPKDNWEVIIQPPAAFKREEPDGTVWYEINPLAENLRNVRSSSGAADADADDEKHEEKEEAPDLTDEERGMRWYRNQIDNWLAQGRTDVVDNNFCLLDVPVVDGKPIYPGFSAKRHVSPKELKPVKDRDVIIGMDQSGLHPAAVFVQNQGEKWCVLDEIYAEGEGFEDFLHGMLVPLIRQRYRGCPIVCAIDPSNERDSAFGVSPKERLEEAGLKVAPFRTNKPRTRIYAVEMMLNRFVGGLLIDPLCKLLIRGFTHEYRYRKLRAAGTLNAAYAPLPEKNDASHVHDALQYAVLHINALEQRDDEAVSRIKQKLKEKRKTLTRLV